MTFWDWADKHVVAFTLIAIVLLIVVDAAQANFARVWRERGK